MTDVPMVSIPQDRFKQLLKAQRELSALEAYGVDNWEGYSGAMRELYGNEDEDEEI